MTKKLIVSNWRADGTQDSESVEVESFGSSVFDSLVSSKRARIHLDPLAGIWEEVFLPMLEATPDLRQFIIKQ